MTVQHLVWLHTGIAAPEDGGGAGCRTHTAPNGCSSGAGSTVLHMLVFETAIGLAGVEYGEAGITEVLMPGRGQLDDVQPDDLTEAPPEIREAIEGIIALMAGEPRDLTHIALDQSSLDDFRRSVYAATRAIGPGETKTYGEIARAIGDPGAARAVGAALGSNPFPIVVPCHRVLAADGALHGFSAPGGIVTKRRMLEIENAPGFTQQALFS